jgi:hypothetical protein
MEDKEKEERRGIYNLMITHSKVSSKEDGPDNSLIQPTDWNDNHVIADGNSFMQINTVTFDNDEIMALFQSGVLKYEIVPAPGSGKMILPFNVIFILYIEPGGEYISSSIENMTFGLSFGSFATNSTGVILNVAGKNILNASQIMEYNGTYFFGGIDNMAEEIENVYLGFYNTIQLNDLSGGNAANYLKIISYYMVIDL